MNIFIDNNTNTLYDEYGQEMTPYHRLIQVDDFAVILDEIKNGTIPTATGQPFPVYPVENFEQTTFGNNVPSSIFSK